MSVKTTMGDVKSHGSTAGAALSDQTKYVELQDIPILYVAVTEGMGGPPDAFAELEGRLPTLRGRRFYGLYYADQGRYLACVRKEASDDPKTLGLEELTISGGLYARRMLKDWGSRVDEIPRLFGEMVEAEETDSERPSVEFYRSQTEVHLLLPVLTRSRSRTERSQAYPWSGT